MTPPGPKTEGSPPGGGLRAYAAVTASYWAFMLTDGALRMLVLLHFHTIGFSPVQRAYLCVLYEIAGMATNLSAGWIAARFGLTSTLYAGLALQIVALLALTAGCCIAAYALLTRHLSTAAPPLVTQAYTSLVGMIGTAVLLPFVWQTPDAADWLRMAVMGSVGAFGHYFMIRAFEQAPASVISPFIYAEIVMATLIGYLWFGDFPDAFTWTGIAILIASGIYLSWREHVVQRAARRTGT